MKMTNAIKEYIKEQNLDVVHLAQVAGISVSKLEEHTNEPLEATEMLRICGLLGIRPEDIWHQVKSQYIPLAFK